MKKFLISILLVVFTLVSLSAGKSVCALDGVQPPTILPKPVNKIVPQIVNYGNGFWTLSYGGNVVDKQSAARSIEIYLDNYLNSRKAEINGNGFSYTLSNSYSAPFGNGHCISRFNSNLDFNLPRGFTTRITVKQSTSYAEWTGTSPQYTATSIQITDSFTFSGIHVSVSIGVGDTGGSFGGSFSTSGNTAVYTGEKVPNVWYTAQGCANVTGSGGLTSFKETSTAHFHFESCWMRDFHVVSSNSMWV